ncbi:3-phosphoshikimate 1-carboxyvinyltransferase [Paludicola sp. MB14-C6]|uniref:3-phosphoshikimate 1-carboxyvinyltransferase n=1 Tax=Paludihabitans sp. MB14-C6 TaxID=3070656 RepID=UPI0027DBD236|nr:3-phosphoshikimate 1-carboxyvinyltransferase [Paludicola sp. MB14-C6]WMJ22526.1 3-phosphoshikimate 1-carboxyvinyltransferase [Paludicola sp. MB14-C6]
MKATIYPSVCKKEVTIPPSKSMSHRAIICACLAKGKSVVSNIAYSDDTKATIEGMRQLGANITEHKSHLEIEGTSDFSRLNHATINCKESGSTLRFFIPIFSFCNQEVTFLGENRLLKRPQAIYETIFQKQGLTYEQTDSHIKINGSLQAGEYTLDGNVSSQFITGLLFALPLLNGDSTIHIKPPFESRSYVDLTLQVLEDFGVKVMFLDDNTIFIQGNQTYQPCNYTVEGDFSQFAFFAVLGAINNDIRCLGMKHNSLQGDKVILSILKQCGIQVDEIENGYLIHKGKLHGTEIDLSNCPDLGPILTILAMYAKGTTKIYNAGRLRLKESDRIEAMETELKKIGVPITTTEDTIQITGDASYHCTQQLFAHKDHRIAMSLAVAIACSNQIATIDGVECVNKSYPAFFEDLQKVGVKVDILN